MGKSQGDKNRQCPQCGADLGYISGRRRLSLCPFCGSRLYIAPGEAIDRWMIRPALLRSECHRLLSAWLWENYQGAATSLEIGRGLWVPWLSRQGETVGRPAGRKLRLAGGQGVDHLEAIGLPPGEYQPFERERSGGFELSEGQEPGRDEDLIYVPCYTASFIYGGSRRTAVIEASTGRMAGFLPDNRERRLVKWSVLAGAGALFLLEAVFIRGLLAKTVALGLTFFVLEIAAGLVWEGRLWRR